MAASSLPLKSTPCTGAGSWLYRYGELIPPDKGSSELMSTISLFPLKVWISFTILVSLGRQKYMAEKGSLGRIKNKSSASTSPFVPSQLAFFLPLRASHSGYCVLSWSTVILKVVSEMLFKSWQACRLLMAVCRAGDAGSPHLPPPHTDPYLIWPHTKGS